MGSSPPTLRKKKKELETCPIDRKASWWYDLARTKHYGVIFFKDYQYLLLDKLVPIKE
jgi:hypothetical protein